MEEPEWSEEEGAYLVSNLGELNWVRNDLDNDYVLVNDIDGGETDNWNDGRGWEPIGENIPDRDTEFVGSFNGQGHEIKDLYIDRPDEDYVSFFGVIKDAKIENVGIVTDVTGGSGVGGLIGGSEGGEIRNSFAAGEVIGNEVVGGLVGWNVGELSDSYTACNVTGNSNVGGLVGRIGYSKVPVVNPGYVYNSYSVGEVDGDEQVGGLVGWLDSGEVEDSFWDVETSGQDSSDGGTGKTTEEMKSLLTFKDAGWDITGVKDERLRNNDYTWNIVDGETYPFLSWEPPESPPGEGSKESPYEISNWWHLNYIRHELDAYYELVESLDETTAGYEELAGSGARDGEGWKPIGYIDYPDYVGFEGILNGQGGEIKDLYIDRPDEHYVGVFGYNEGYISDIGVVNVNITGEGIVGCLVGSNVGEVIYAYSIGVVTGIDGVEGGEKVGGLIGGNGSNGIVSNSYAEGEVIGERMVGGLIGSGVGEVTGSYSNSDVTGERYGVGGLIGYKEGGVVKNSYATGKVTGGEHVGGLVGESYGRVSNTFATGEVVGDNYVGGLVGGNFHDEGVKDSFSDKETTKQDEVVGRDEGTSINVYALPTEELRKYETYTADGEYLDESWDIEIVWADENNYPYLAWEEGTNSTWLIEQEKVNPAYFEIDIVDTNSPVTEGDNLIVETMVHNTGDIEDSQDITLHVGDPVGQDVDTYHNLSLEADASEEIELVWKTEVNDAGDYDIAVFSENDHADEVVKIEEELKQDEFEVSNFEVDPEIVDPNETVKVSADITNVGDETGERQVEFFVEDAVEDSETVELGGGETTTVEFETSRMDAGEYEATIDAQDDLETGTFTVEEEEVEYSLTIDVKGEGITTPAQGTYTYKEGEEVTLEAVPEEGWEFDKWIGDVENPDSATTSIFMDENKEVQAVFVEPAKFEVSNLDITPREVEPGGSVTISVEVLNDGGETDDYDVWLDIDGKREDSETVSLSPGESKKVEFITSRENEGSYEVEVDGLSDNFVVEPSGEWVPYTPEKENIEIDIFPPFPSEDNEITAEVTITFNHQGYRVKDWGQISQNDNVFFVDTEIERLTGPTLPAIKTVENSYSLGYLQEGDYKFQFKAWGETVETKEFTVERVNPAFFNIQTFDTNSPVIEGENLIASVRIQNTGDVKDTQDIKLYIDDPVGETVDIYHNLMLEAGEPEEIMLIWETEVNNAGVYDTTASTENDYDNEVVTIDEKPEPAEFELSNFSVNPSEPEQGETMTVSIQITNTGGRGENHKLDLFLNGERINSKTVFLNPDESTTEEFDVTIEKKGNYSLELGKFEKSIQVTEPDVEEGPPWIWIGIGLAVTIAIIIVIFFTIKRAWITGSGGLQR